MQYYTKQPETNINNQNNLDFKRKTEKNWHLPCTAACPLLTSLWTIRTCLGENKLRPCDINNQVWWQANLWRTYVLWMFKKQCSSRFKAAKLKIFLKVENVRLKTEISVQFLTKCLRHEKLLSFPHPACEALTLTQNVLVPQSALQAASIQGQTAGTQQKHEARLSKMKQV